MDIHKLWTASYKFDLSWYRRIRRNAYAIAVYTGISEYGNNAIYIVNILHWGKKKFMLPHKLLRSPPQPCYFTCLKKTSSNHKFPESTENMITIFLSMMALSNGQAWPWMACESTRTRWHTRKMIYECENNTPKKVKKTPRRAI